MRGPAVRGELGAVVMIVLALLLLGGPVSAQQPGAPVAELGLEVMAGYGGRVTGSAWTPVEVTVEPARLLHAEIAVVTRSAGGVVREVREIEAAARTRRVHRFLVPSGPVSVVVTEPGREPVELRAQRGERERGFLVGVLGAVPEGAPSLRSEPTGLTGTWVPVDPAWLDAGPTALEPLAVLVGDAAAFAGLGPAARANLAASVVMGTNLVVVADSSGVLPDLGVPLPASATTADGPGRRAVVPEVGSRGVTLAQILPAAMDEGGGGAGGADVDGDRIVAARGQVGLGSAAVVASAPGEDALGRSGAFWSLLVSRPGSGSASHGEWAVDRLPYQFARMFTDTDGGPPPALPWLALFTTAYVLVVGPVNGFVLARLGRRELAWATVPIVTVIFTAGAFLGVTGGRPPVGLVGSTLVAIDGVGLEVAAVAVRAPTGGERTMELDGAGWSAGLLNETGRHAELREGHALRASMELSALQLGGLVAARASDAGPPLAVSAEATSTGMTVRVRNTGGSPVDGVVVRAATATRTVGALAAGEEQEVEITATNLPTASPFRDPFDGLGGGPPRTFEALLRDRFIDGRPGMVWAVGTQGTGASGARVDGIPATDRGRVLAVGVTPTIIGAPNPFVVRRDVLSTDRDVYRPSPLALDGTSEAFMRFELPAAAELRTLRQRLEGSASGQRAEIAVWVPDSREWQPLAATFGEAGGDPTALLDPFGALWVRVQGELYPFDHSGLSVDGLREDG
jgi:hypothetical protein